MVVRKADRFTWGHSLYLQGKITTTKWYKIMKIFQKKNKYCDILWDCIVYSIIFSSSKRIIKAYIHIVTRMTITCAFVFNDNLAGGLAWLDAKASADTVMTKFGA